MPLTMIAVSGSPEQSVVFDGGDALDVLIGRQAAPSERSSFAPLLLVRSNRAPLRGHGLHESFIYQLAASRRDFVALPGAPGHAAPTFRHEFGVDAEVHQPVAESSVHPWHGKPRVRNVQLE
jgi:hypothetical protein